MTVTGREQLLTTNLLQTSKVSGPNDPQYVVLISDAPFQIMALYVLHHRN